MKLKASEFCQSALETMGVKRNTVKDQTTILSHRQIPKAGSFYIFKVNWRTEYGEEIQCVVERRQNRSSIVEYLFDGKNYLPMLVEMEKNVSTYQ